MNGVIFLATRIKRTLKLKLKYMETKGPFVSRVLEERGGEERGDF